MLLAGIHHSLNLAAVCRFCKLPNRTRFLFDRHSEQSEESPSTHLAKQAPRNVSIPLDDRKIKHPPQNPRSSANVIYSPSSPVLPQKKNNPKNRAISHHF